MYCLLFSFVFIVSSVDCLLYASSLFFASLVSLYPILSLTPSLDYTVSIIRSTPSMRHSCQVIIYFLSWFLLTSISILCWCHFCVESSVMSGL